MILVASVLVAAAVGFFIGSTLVTVGLRRDIADLDVERMELEAAKASLNVQREAVESVAGKVHAASQAMIPDTDEGKRILRASLIRAHIDMLNEPRGYVS